MTKPGRQPRSSSVADDTVESYDAAVRRAVYFRELLSAVNPELILASIPAIATRIPSAMPVAIGQYSMAVAAVSSAMAGDSSLGQQLRVRTHRTISFGRRESTQRWDRCSSQKLARLERRACQLFRSGEFLSIPILIDARLRTRPAQTVLA